MNIRIAYYISGHGYGHLIRSLSLIKFLKTKTINDYPCDQIDKPIFPEKTVDFCISIILNNKDHARIIQTDPELQDNAVYIRNFDLSIENSDLMNIDIETTVNGFRDFINRSDNYLAKEKEFILSKGFDIIISDIGFIPVAAASLAGLPGCILGNFTWEEVFYDYMQKGFHVFNSDILFLLDCYNMADIYFQLPLALKFRLTTKLKRIGFITKKTKYQGNHFKEKFKPMDEYVYVFDTLDIQGKYKIKYNLSDIDPKIRFIIWNRYNDPLQDRNFIYVSEKDIDFEEVLAFSDIIFGKPGYNLLAQSIIFNKKVLLINKGGFIETDTIIKGAGRYIETSVLSSVDKDFFQSTCFSDSINKLNAQRKGIRLKPPLFGEIDFYRHFLRELL